MADAMQIGRLYHGPSTPIGARKSSDSTRQETSFREMLNDRVLKFSHHAEVRMRQRGIELQPEQLTRIASAIDEAEAKGAKDSLVMFRDVAMIVNVPSRTVVTALEGKAAQGNVFTQIDSAVIVT
ncbi:flagellar biosynthesis protein [Paenibacillus sp. IB182496]|uniref:Flagellar biosynthesis protein n=1 Tax=Paenibacillus sabuli TaxID=2772509 RepID=A0A927GRB1_9BACL|nr:TIGR02530 family flagellar biosynthesis protein [Paenibacillus sabuli]MBD2845283.1 flagellar biosynthesis protein [Paenibacillus sabuli]